MASEMVSLFSLADWKNGLAFKQIHFSEKGKPVIKIAELKNGITAQTARTEQDFSPAVHLTKGDMVFSWSGNPETSIDVFLYDLPDGWLNQHIFKVTPKAGVDKLYLYYLLKFLKPRFTAIASNKQTTGLGHVTVKDLKELCVPLHDMEKQQAIASYLYAIDKKIYVNNKINSNLQQQAQILFSKQFCLQSEDPIPNGWKLTTLGDVAVISTKSFNPLKQPETLLEHYSIPAFDENCCPVFELSTAIKSNKYVVDSDCFMISKLNPTTKRVWRPYCMTQHAVCSTEFIVYKAKDRDLTDFLFSLIDSTAFSNFMCSHVTGSTGSRQRTTPADTLQYQFYMPTADEIEAFSGAVAPMYAKIRINSLENARLKELRDSLLPRLMSGEIDVTNIGI